MVVDGVAAVIDDTFACREESSALVMESSVRIVESSAVVADMCALVDERSALVASSKDACACNIDVTSTPPTNTRWPCVALRCKFPAVSRPTSASPSAACTHRAARRASSAAHTTVTARSESEQR